MTPQTIPAILVPRTITSVTLVTHVITMDPAQPVQLNSLTDLRDAARKYMDDNIGWRAEDRDLVWSYRYVAAKLSLLHGQTMTFGDLTKSVAATLSETSSPLVRQLTPELIAEKLCTPIPITEAAETQEPTADGESKPADA